MATTKQTAPHSRVGIQDKVAASQRPPIVDRQPRRAKPGIAPVLRAARGIIPTMTDGIPAHGQFTANAIPIIE
jgi:hypothetical protein